MPLLCGVCENFLHMEPHVGYTVSRQPAPVAQRIERLPPEQEATGSSPVGRTKYSMPNAALESAAFNWFTVYGQCCRAMMAAHDG